MQKAIPYYRVSTDKQGDSGLGLEAQQRAVQQYATYSSLQLAGEFIEIESGSTTKRPVLNKALQECRKTNGLLLIAKLDRLARDVAFISTLMKSDIRFVAVDNPNANELMLHIMAAFAEYERKQISQRTKDALAAAKRRGVVLGVNGREVLSKKNREDADLFAIKMRPVIQALQQEGFENIRAIVGQLNKRRIKPYRKGKHKWHVQTVHSLIKRIENLTSNA